LVYTARLGLTVSMLWACKFNAIRAQCIVCTHIRPASRHRMHYLHCAITSNQSYGMFIFYTIKVKVTNSKSTHVQGRGYFWSPVWQALLPVSCPVVHSVSPSPVLHAVDDAPEEGGEVKGRKRRGREEGRERRREGERGREEGVRK